MTVAARDGGPSSNLAPFASAGKASVIPAFAIRFGGMTRNASHACLSAQPELGFRFAESRQFTVAQWDEFLRHTTRESRRSNDGLPKPRGDLFQSGGPIHARP